MAVRALLAVAGLLAATLPPVRSSPEDPQSRSMMPRGIITADMFKNNRQDGARKLALPPAVQMASGKFRRSVDVDNEPWAATPTDQLFQRSSDEITFHDLFNMGAAAYKNPYIVYATERSKSENAPISKSDNSTYGQSSFKTLGSKIDAANPYKMSEISGPAETERVSKNKTFENSVKPFRYRKRKIHSQPSKQDIDISTGVTIDEKETVRKLATDREDSKIDGDKFPLTKSQLFDLFDDSRPDDFDDDFEISAEIKLLRKSNSTNLEERNSTVVDSKPLIVQLRPVDHSEWMQTLRNNSSLETQVRNNDTASATLSIKRAEPSVLLSKTRFKPSDMTWKGFSRAEKYYLSENRFPKLGGVLKRDITTPVAKSITHASDKGDKVSANKISNAIGIVSPVPPSRNKSKTFSFAKPTSYSRPTYFTDVLSRPLSLAPPVPPIMSVLPSTGPKQPSFHSFNNMFHAGLPLNHIHMMRVPGNNHLFPNYSPRTHGFRPAGWNLGSQFSITPQPTHPGIYFTDPASRLRATHPRVNDIPGNFPQRFRTPLHPPPIVMKSVTEAPGSVPKQQLGTPPRLPNAVESPLHPGEPPSLIQRPPGLLNPSINQQPGQQPRQKRRPAHSNSNANQSPGSWSNFIQRLTGLRSSPTTQKTAPATRLAQRLPDPAISFANEVAPVGLTPPSVVNVADTLESEKNDESSDIIQLIPNFQGPFWNHPTAYHPLIQTIVAKSPELFHGQQTSQLINVIQSPPGRLITEGNELQLVPINGVKKKTGVIQVQEFRQLAHRSPIIVEVTKEAESRSSREISTSEESKTLNDQMIPPPALDAPGPENNFFKTVVKRQQLQLAKPIPSSAQQHMILYPVISPYAFSSNQLVSVRRNEPEAVKIIDASNESE